MDRAELLEAIEDLQGRLDVMPDGIIGDEQYESLSDSLATLKTMLGRRHL